MANQEHVDILRQGIDVWNKWREEHPEIQPDLSNADLKHETLIEVDPDGKDYTSANFNTVNFSGADLSQAFLCGSNLMKADLGGAKLEEIDLRYANLRGANLKSADLSGAFLYSADLSRANLSQARIHGADLSDTNLAEANFAQAYLYGTMLTGAALTEVNLNGTYLSGSVFARVDLRLVRDLDKTIHYGPSILDLNTIVLSHGQIPKRFLQDAGTPDFLIAYIRSLVGKPIEYYTCFISYSSKDQEFAERLYADLQSKNVRCWYAPEDLKIGDKFRVRIDESIRLYDKLLLILSEHSVKSPWVEKEVETAFEKEYKSGKLTLFPVKLDNTVMETNQAWAADIQRTRHIGDFTRWKEHDEYQKALTRLLRDLKQDATTENTSNKLAKE